MAHGGIHATDSPPEDWSEETSDDRPAPAGTDPPTGYGVDYGGRAYILVPGNIRYENNVIPTDSITLFRVDDDPELKGFTAGDPDNNPDTVEGMGLGVVGGRGEGMRSAEATRDADGEFIGEAQTAIEFELGTSLSTATMGIGFVNLSTNGEEGFSSSKLFFNYSNISQEPLFRATGDDITIRDNSISYNISNPFDYAEDEAVAIRAKFGWDPTLGTGKYTNAYMDGFDRSVSKIVEALITTYPINLATFPRTPPMKIRGKDMSLLRGSEEIEDDPLGAEAVESTITEGGTMEPTTGYE